MGRVSPVFDVARLLLLVDIEGSREVARSDQIVEPSDPFALAHRFRQLGVTVLICGAISKPVKAVLRAEGIKVIDQVCGNSEAILQAFQEGRLGEQAFLMPGCKAAAEGSSRLR